MSSSSPKLPRNAPSHGAVAAPATVSLNERAIQSTLASYAQPLEVHVSVDTAEDYAAVGEILLEVKGQTKALTAERDGVLKPMNEAVKRVRALFAPALASLAKAESDLKGALIGYVQRQEQLKAQQAAEAQRLLRAAPAPTSARSVAARAVAVDQAMALVESVNAAPTTVAGLSTRKVWRAEVVDPNQVPAQFWVIDMVAVTAHAKANGWANAPAGIEYVQDVSMAASPGRGGK